jgi:hypothetical protein
MIINLKQLTRIVNERDDNVNFETCDINVINRLEERAIKAYKIINDIEELANELFEINKGKVESINKEIVQYE